MPRTPIHPGEHLAEQLEALGMSAAAHARLLCIPRRRVASSGLNGRDLLISGRRFESFRARRTWHQII
jgi:plasmid maintenance system antidote protein VapI